MATTRIRNLNETCKCGCKGRDHKTHYIRAVRKVVSCRIAFGDDKIITATGTARFPWGEEPVRQVVWAVNGRELSLGWEIAR